METIVYWGAAALVRFLQALPLPLVAWLGRRGGAVAGVIDRRHRRVARENLRAAFQSEKSPAELRGILREHFRRLGENYASAVKTASMKPEALARRVEFVGGERFGPTSAGEPSTSRVFAIGHFGNFELYASAGYFVPGYKMVTTYRALPQSRLNTLLLSLRRRSGLTVFERGAERAEFFRKLNEPGLFVGLLSDQHAGAGVWLPFFGRECSTITAPAVIAQRYGLPLYTAVCFRTGLARWRIEIGDEIPTHEGRTRRPVADVMRDVNRAFETAVRRDPANWFWVHRRWKAKPRPREPRSE